MRKVVVPPSIEPTAQAQAPTYITLEDANASLAVVHVYMNFHQGEQKV